LVLRDFQQEAVESLAAAALDAVAKMAAAPAERRRIARHIGCSLLQAPTGSGKTVMLARTVEVVSQRVPIVWFWFAPFAGLVSQTATALRAAAPGLRVRDPTKDRVDVGSRAGDVFAATWASVAARRADARRMRQDDDNAPSLDTLIGNLRASGFGIGAVVDEAHHSFRPGSESFRFLDAVLDPDLLMCASATPDDNDVEILRRGLDVGRFQRVSVSRTRVVEARLNKPRVRAISFLARGTAAELLDLNEVALRKAVEQHRTLKRMLKEAGIPIVPLLLVQASSSAWTPARVQAFLRGPLQFSTDAVATHTSAEPDPDVQALANDPDVEVLVFKMAVATGFDALRAFTLCALRPVVDADFGMQIIGRIMRVHPLLQSPTRLAPELDTGWVFLGDPQGMPGLESAADRIKALRDAISILSDGLQVYDASVGEDGRIALVGEDGQSRMVLDQPSTAPLPAAPTSSVSNSAVPTEPWPETLFTFSESAAGPVPAPGNEPQSTAAPDLSSTTVSAQRRPSAVPMAFRYPRRSGVVAPECLRTERMPRDVKGLLEALVRNVYFLPEHLLAIRQESAPVERREGDLFERAAQSRRLEQSNISFRFASQSAHELLSVSQYIAAKELGLRLQDRLARALNEAQQAPVERAILQRALNVILVQSPNLLKDALRRAMADCADVEDAAELPQVWESAVQLTESPLNLYGCMPQGLNTWEQRFADWLDLQDRVVWWTRNPSRPNAADNWSVRIMLPETGRGYYPDFVVCVDGRKKRDGIKLAETKERTETEASAIKSRTEHREYGFALMVSYDGCADRFLRIEYAPEIGRNREVGPLRPEDLLL
jgi:hypothetical protein